jgi:thioredoxin reductase (NADPH)
MKNDEMATDYVNVCIIGSGVVGLFLASKLLASNISTVVLESSNQIGGQINLYSNKTIYNIPLIKSTSGAEILSNLVDDIKKFSHDIYNIICLNTSIINIIKEEDSFEITTNLKKVRCKYLVFAFGAGEMEQNKIKIEGSEILENNKMLFYSVNDKEKFYSKDLVICGGGDSVIDWTCELCDICKSITIVHRREINRHENPSFLKFNLLHEQGKICFKIPYNITRLSVDDKKNKLNVEILSEKDKQNIECDYILALYGFKVLPGKIIDLCRNINIDCDKNKILVDYYSNETKCKYAYAVGDCCSYNGKINSIFMGFADATKCFYDICNREYGKIDIYEHKR